MRYARQLNLSEDDCIHAVVYVGFISCIQVIELDHNCQARALTVNVSWLLTASDTNQCRRGGCVHFRKIRILDNSTTDIITDMSGKGSHAVQWVCQWGLQLQGLSEFTSAGMVA